MENYFLEIGGKEKIALIKSTKEISFNWFRRNKDEDSEKARLVKTMTILKEPYYKKFVSYDSRGIIDNEFYYNERGSVLAMGSVIQKNEGKSKISTCITSDLLKWYEAGELEYAGEKTLEGADQYSIRKHDRNTTQIFFFNKATHLLDASQIQEWPDRITYYGDYRATNLVLHPFSLKGFQKNIIYYKQVTESFEFNPEIDTEIFYFNEKEYEKRSEPKIKYPSKKLEVTESDLDGFIKSNFRGKRVFIDMWATWCAPCKKEFKSYDSAFYITMDNRSINLVYLSIDKDENEKAWENDIKKLGLKGFHGRVNKKMILALQSSIFDGGTIIIPRYVLIDDQGKIISKNFVRPSDPSFKSEIEKIFPEQK